MKGIGGSRMTPQSSTASTAKFVNKAGDNNARRNYIEEQWNQFKSAIDIPKDATWEQINGVRHVFFAGAWAMACALKNDSAIVNEICDEMEAYRDRVHRDHEKRKQAGTL